VKYPERKTFPKTGSGPSAKKGTTIFHEDYIGLSFDQRLQKAALEGSGNGKCWWIYDYLLTPVYTGEERARVKDDIIKAGFI
jgi:hypothetical protein